MNGTLNQFLIRHADFSKPMILALSGGPDSLALLQLLLSSPLPIDLHLAHVDHQWRSESSQEAAALQSMAQDLGLPFHLKILDPTLLQGNLEAASRDKRLEFFLELKTKLNAQAVLLGHHANDQAETILTRVMEGRFLASMRGIEEVAQVNGVTLWRPLLSFTKLEIEEYFKDQELLIEPVVDPTNLDKRFMRGRLRKEIMPELARTFGKEITGSLCRFGQEVAHLNDFLKGLIDDYLKETVTGPFGTLLNLSEKMPSHSFLLRHLVRCFCEDLGVSLSHHLLHTTCEWLEEGAADRQLEMGHRILYIDRKRLFVMRENLVVSAAWNVQTQPHVGEKMKGGWLDLWRGRARFSLPAGQYSFGPVQLSAPYPGKTPIRKWWSDHKIPAFFRSFVPVVWSEGRIVHEFLTGRSELLKGPDEMAVLVQWNGE